MGNPPIIRDVAIDAAAETGFTTAIAELLKATTAKALMILDDFIFYSLKT